MPGSLKRRRPAAGSRGVIIHPLDGPATYAGILEKLVGPLGVPLYARYVMSICNPREPSIAIGVPFEPAEVPSSINEDNICNYMKAVEYYLRRRHGDARVNKMFRYGRECVWFTARLGSQRYFISIPEKAVDEAVKLDRVLAELSYAFNMSSAKRGVKRMLGGMGAAREAAGRAVDYWLEKALLGGGERAVYAGLNEPGEPVFKAAYRIAHSLEVEECRYDEENASTICIRVGPPKAEWLRDLREAINAVNEYAHRSGGTLANYAFAAKISGTPKGSWRLEVYYPAHVRIFEITRDSGRRLAAEAIYPVASILEGGIDSSKAVLTLSFSRAGSLIKPDYIWLELSVG